MTIKKHHISNGAYALALAIVLSCVTDTNQFIRKVDVKKEQIMKDSISQGFIKDGLKTNTAKTLIPMAEILRGGPAKDGIPALADPKFVTPSEVDLDESAMGVWLKGEKSSKFYPYSILVWHEIANDVIDDTPVAVTFCPLCGSAIAFNREVNGELYEFGVSGKLWQSNMLMFDRTTESLWSQIEGKAMVGDLLGTELSYYPVQLLSYKEALALDPNVSVLSKNTGHVRDYSRYPYGDYDNNEQLFFPVKNSDKRLPMKALMVAGDFKGEAFAFNRVDLLSEKEAVLKTKSGELTARVSESNEVTVTDEAGVSYPTYITMWFSWANHNEGPVWST